MSPETKNHREAAAAAEALEPEPPAEPAPEIQSEAAEPAAPPAPELHAEPADVSTSAPTETSEAALAEPEAAGPGMEALLEQYTAPQQASAEGEVVEGRVVAVTELGVVVDIGAKSEGLIPAQEFVDSPTGIPLTPGQTVEVQHQNEEKEGYLLLSYQRLRRKRVWEKVEKSYRTQATMDGRIVDRVKGGLVVDIGIPAFLPASQVDLRPVPDLDEWKGRDITCRVLKLNRKRGNVVVSRRAMLEDEQKTRRQQLLESLAEGAVLTGKVKNITDYGVFVDLGGVDGLLHVTDLAWGRIHHPSEAVQAGQEIEVQVLKYDREKRRISLGRKQLLPDPWALVPERYPAGSRVQGRVVGVTDYGAFVELEPGIEGLVHVSEMTWSKRVRHPSKIVSAGDTVDVVVLELKPDQRRISLGLKQTLPDPWEHLAEKYPVGSLVSGRVRNLTEFGAFVEIEEGIDGLIHVSDISWTSRVQHPSETFRKGETVQAKVLKIDRENRRLSLGIKQMNDIWAGWFEKHSLNQVVRGKVSRATSFGVFVELAEGIEGLCHISEIESRRPPRGEQGGRGEKDKKQRGGKPGVTLETGKEYDFKIIRLDPEQRKIGLSYRAAQKQAEKQEMAEYRSSKSSSTATIGDAILAKRELA